MNAWPYYVEVAVLVAAAFLSGALLAGLTLRLFVRRLVTPPVEPAGDASGAGA